MPAWKDEISKHLASLQLEPAREAEIVEELAQHLDGRYQEMLAGGASEEEARRATLAELSQSDMLAKELRRVERPALAEPVVLGAGKGIETSPTVSVIKLLALVSQLSRLQSHWTGRVKLKGADNAPSLLRT